MDEKTKEFFLELEKARSKKGLTEKLGTITGFVGAITGLIAAGFAIYLGIQTLNLQDQIEDRQKVLDRKEENLSLNRLLQDENSRISLIFVHFKQATCATLPIGDTEVWKKYASCLAGEEIDSLETFDFNSYGDLAQRFECLKNLDIQYCRGMATN